ncbi:efflux RND transporter periplasmic adaptor subunit [Desulfosediminicola flagellatus]|uniref:efflux RND transporter periplasmic adaptor subunit n=1 Tax=Desulfosediminicola flagellatus TaxID=2569541 RepID=UPI0010AB8F88|nr:efflux RND transporter periplasmic adaptor subunit [Desulfosediminicola flagellatus]
MKKRVKIILPIIAAGIIIIFVYRFITHKDDDSSLKFSGNIEVTEAQMSFRIAGRLEKRLVDEGDSVHAGQILALLNTDDQTIAVSQAEASLAYANAVLAELEAGSRQEDIDEAEAKVQQARQSLTELQNGSRIQEIEASKAELESARAAEQSAIVQFKQAKNDVTRYTHLYSDNSISKTILESSQTLFKTAENQVKVAMAKARAAEKHYELLKAGPRIEQIRRAEAVLQQAKAEYDRIKAGPRKESIDQARAKVQVAMEAARQARQQLHYTKLIAPTDAVVLSTSAEAGEYLNPASPVLTLGRVDTPWLRAYIHEKSLGRIQLNQEVKVSTDSFPDKTYSGRVSYISSQAEFTPKTVQTFEERVKLMFRIKVALDNPDNELKPGMPADGYISLAASQEN